MSKVKFLYRIECEREKKIFYSFVKHLLMKMLNKKKSLIEQFGTQVYDLFC